MIASFLCPLVPLGELFTKEEKERNKMQPLIIDQSGYHVEITPPEPVQQNEKKHPDCFYTLPDYHCRLGFPYCIWSSRQNGCPNFKPYPQVPVEKEAEVHTSCEGCKRKTHDDMEKWLDKHNSDMDVKISEECLGCFTFDYPKQARDNYTPKEPAQEETE